MEPMDTTKMNKKIIFDETGSPKKRKLLESDEEDEEFKFPDDKQLKSKTKLSKLQSTVGNDERFTLDNRFIEDEDQEEEKLEDETEFSEERKKQLEILGDVLGKPIFTGSKKQDERNHAFKSAGNMIRYDPTNENHHEYEIVSQKPEKAKKKKKKKEIEKVEEAEPVPVSNEVFYSVSDKLTNALGEGEQFSLLKTLGKDSIETNNEQPEIYKCESKKNKFGLDFGSNKAFKYDTSDDEEPSTDSPAEVAKNKSKSERVDSSNSNENSDRFLFVINDSRFQECEVFFKNRSERSEDLKTLRPKLKQTIRKRIQTNLKKNSVMHKRKLNRKKY